MDATEDQREEGPEEDTTLANTEVVTKYQEAAKIVNTTLAEIIALVSQLTTCDSTSIRSFVLQ